DAAGWTIDALHLSAAFLIVNAEAATSAPPAPVVLTLTGASTWTGGMISGGVSTSTSFVDSQVVIAAGASLTVAGTAAAPPQQQPGTQLINSGTIDWTSGDWCVAGVGIQNNSGATFNLSASNSVSGLTASCISGASSTLTNAAGATMNRTGAAGTAETINLPFGFTNNGTLAVSTLLNVAGGYSSGSTSVYRPAINGSGAAGTGFGRLAVGTQTYPGAPGAAVARPAGTETPAQTASSPGTIIPVTAGGFHPANAEQFAVITCSASCAGGYAATAGGYTVQQSGAAITLVAAAQAAAAPGSLNFGTGLVGTSVGPLTVTLSNAGTGVLTVGGVALSGSAAGAYALASDSCQPSSAPGSVNPRGSCMVGVSFNPKATGALAAQLNITDDAPGSPQVVALSGSGTSTPASVVPPPSPIGSASPAPSRTSTAGSSPGSSPGSRPSPSGSPVVKGETLTRTPTPTATPSPSPGAPTPSASASGDLAAGPAGPASGGAPPSFTALSPNGFPYGPAGSGLNTAVHHYPPGCTTVYFFFGSVRIGSAPVNSSGQAAATGLSVPGDAKPGQYQITSSCEPSGAKVELTAAFRVTPGLHRTAFVTSLNPPSHIALTLHGIVLSALIAALILILLAFPSQLFNATLQEHYEEVRRWFHLSRPLSEVAKDLNQRVLFPVFLAVGGLLFALITPDFGFNRSTLALVLGLAIAVAIVTLGFAGPTFLFYLHHYKDRGQVLVMPGSVIVAAVCVLVSRVLRFEPGYLYGLLAIFVFHHESDEKIEGKLAAASALLVIVLAILTWVARIPLTGLTQKNPSFLALVGEAALGGAFVIGVESVLVGLLPMRFLDGARIKRWNTWAWLGLFGFGIFTAVEVLIQPGTGYVGHTSVAGRFTVLSLYLAFCAISVGFWAYFRYRTPKSVEEELDTEGDFGVR
ncbi:MAG TPA: FGLLP motif-containing membrane protein, partial [Actinomycetota bacterium]|nr:FGLLP motif-containing membrane protein [Actinomycetota bacterium]